MGARHRKRKAQNDGKGEAKAQKSSLPKHDEAISESLAGEEEENEALEVMEDPKTHSAQEMSDLIAELSEQILESPDSAFEARNTVTDNHPGDKQNTDAKPKAKQPSPMKKLLSIAASQKGPQREHTAHLAILSLLAVFKDIIPAYRVRLPTDKEMAVKVSKETKRMWDYERALLNHYQQFLKLLEKTWEKKGGKGYPEHIASVAIMSMAELLKSAFHFNFRSNLITAVVKPMNHPVVGEACCAALAHVFANDAQGEVALEAARQVSKMIIARKFHVGAQVLRTFLSLPLRVHVDEAQAAKLAAVANKKKRKLDKELAAIEAELKEGDANVDKLKLARNQSDTLQAVTMTYFRILKSDNLNNLKEVLPVTLEGLAKFAHLINLDTVVDLLAVLKKLLQNNMDGLPLDAAMNCILTAFEALRGPGRELKIDYKDYIAPLYSQIPRITSDTNSAKNVETLLRCLFSVFIKGQEFSNVRVAAFCKQLLTAALHCPPHTSVPLIAFCRHLFLRYPSARQLLENESDVVTSGDYDPDAADPEQSNPYATSAWELALLKFHIQGTIVSHAKAAASSKQLQFPAERPERLRKELLEDSDMLYIPFTSSNSFLKKHPLHPKAGAKKPRPRFITPRKSMSLLLEEDNTEGLVPPLDIFSSCESIWKQKSVV